MSTMLDHVIAQVLTLHVRLLACQARLAADTDSEALHDLRTSVRRLRSLLRPLRGYPGVDQLEAAAAAVGQLTTPLRDSEVLAAQLLERGQMAAAQQRLAGRPRTFAAVAASAELTKLLGVVDAFPMFLRAAQRQQIMRKLKPRIDKRLDKQWRQLLRALHDPAHDRHRLRLLIKRVRYGAEAYPQLDHLPAALRRTLKRAQGDLGNWHDLLQWLLQAEQQPDLGACVAHWREQQVAAEHAADRTLEALVSEIKRR